MTTDRSSAEAEYCAIANAVAVGFRQLLAELHRPLHQATVIFGGNTSVVYLSTNPVQHQWAKLLAEQDHVWSVHVPMTHEPNNLRRSRLYRRLVSLFRRLSSDLLGNHFDI